MEKAYRGDWVEIHQVILQAGERAPQVPEDTQKVPLELRCKGWLHQEEGVKGDEVEIQTPAGRLLRGQMISVNPPFLHGFGRAIPELLALGPELRQLLRKEGSGQ